MSVYRERERFDDSKTTVSARTSGGTKVTRYIVKEDDTRTDVGRQSRYDDGKQSRYDDTRSNYAASRYDNDRGDTRAEEIRILRTSREDEEPQRAYGTAYTAREPAHTKTRETITIRRDESPERRDEYWRRPPGEQVEDRELVIRRTVDRDDGPRDRGREASLALSKIDDRKESVAVSRYDDRKESRFSDYEVVSPQRGTFGERDRDVQRYIRTTDYYQPQMQQPQTIIIRQEPIIIRERERAFPREEDFQIVKKSETDETRSVSRRSDRTERTERNQPRDEEYFYEKRVRERLPDEDRGERRLTRRPISPGDSVSQAGRRDQGYESDDSMVYVRKETKEGYGSDDGHKKRDLAAGAIAGIGAAELLRSHNQKEGKETSQGIGRAARDAGAGILGAVAAEGIRRYRSKSRRRGSSSRSSSGERYGRRGSSRHGRSRSRSESNGRLKTVGGLGLAAAAVAAGAFFASRNKKAASPEDSRRSRSRKRGGSRSRSRASSGGSDFSDLVNDPNADNERNPKTRNQRTAAAGAVGAAAMALYERHRSKSRGRASSESPNRLKQGAPIALAGLGAAGLAHLYEKRRAKEEAKEIVEDEQRRSRSRSRSKSRSGRTNSTYYDGPRTASYSEPGLIQYGTEPLYGNNYGEGYYGRPNQEQDYYHNNTREIVPAPVPPPAAASFDANARRPRSASRTRSLSSSPDTRTRSRSRGAVAAAAAAGAGVAASEYEARKKEKKDRKRRSRQKSRERRDSYAPYTDGRDPYEDANWHATHSQSYAQGMHDNDPYASQSGFHPAQSQFPPPPGSMPQQGYAPQQAPTPTQPTYTSQSFPPPPAGAPQAQQMNYDPYAPNQNPYAPRMRGSDNNVSAASSFPVSNDQHHSTTDGINGARASAMSPANVGPNITVQRPSISTFAGMPLSGSGVPPGVTSSRAARTYTPPIQSDVRAERERSTSSQPTPQPRQIPVVTDRPTPLATPKPIPEHPAATRFKKAAYAAVTLPQPDTDPVVTQPKQPEMTQTNRGTTPFMPSPDLRPPSDDRLPTPQQYRNLSESMDSGPSMPIMTIPNGPSTHVGPTEERRDRSRSLSRSQSRTGAGDATPRATTPMQESKKSVTFASKPEFSDAPKVGLRAAPELEAEKPDTTPYRKDDGDRERRRPREYRGYDGGDDFSDDTPLEDHKRRSRDRSGEGDQDRERDRGTRHSSRRERSNTQVTDGEADRDRYQDSKRSNTIGASNSRQNPGESPGSDTTVDLPERFDEKGRRKRASRGGGDRNAEEDDLAEKLDTILGGLGLFGGGSSKKR